MTTSPRNEWRVVDIVVAAVIAVAFGVVFLAWNAIYAATEPLFLALPPSQAIMYGVWLLPAVLVGLIVRRPGAALFGGFVSAAVSVLLGSPYGIDALISGAIQGAGAEVAFAIGLYRSWGLTFAVLAGVLSGLAAAVHDIVVYYPDFGLNAQLVYAGATAVSGALIAGVGAWLLLRALVATGVLHEFAAGRDQAEV
ncbi:MAG TPA: ECF transporter S component [Candidatus Limnocylindria bacterium]|nr:ECF transporter S component [Candidatus Limnocylindria bacterium]